MGRWVDGWMDDARDNEPYRIRTLGPVLRCHKLDCRQRQEEGDIQSHAVLAAVCKQEKEGLGEAGKRRSGGQWMERSIERTEANPRNTHNFMGWMKYVRRLTAFRSITGMIKLRM